MSTYTPRIGSLVEAGEKLVAAGNEGNGGSSDQKMADVQQDLDGLLTKLVSLTIHIVFLTYIHMCYAEKKNALFGGAAAALWYTLRNASTVTSTSNDLAGRIEESPIHLEQENEQMVVTPVGAPSTKVPEKKKKENFLYLTMTENCLPNHLASSRAIADATACDCEVMVLSYKPNL